MPKGLPRSLSRGAATSTPIIRQTITVDDVIPVADGAPGFGSVAVAGLPKGNILFLGAVSYLTFSTDDADVIATFDGDYSVGTAATTGDIQFNSDRADMIAPTALGAATAKSSGVVRGDSTDAPSGDVYDNTDGGKVVNVNLLIDDASISGAADFNVTGIIHLSYIVLGDD